MNIVVRSMVGLAVIGALASGCAATQKVSVGATQVSAYQLPSVALDVNCGLEKTTVEAAVDAYSTLLGTAPATGADLVTAGYLREFPTTSFTLTPSADGTTAVVVGIGPCAGS